MDICGTPPSFLLSKVYCFMDKYITQSITARREAFGTNCEIDAETQGKIDALFAEIEKLGAKCKDVGGVETEFAKKSVDSATFGFIH